MTEVKANVVLAPLAALIEDVSAWRPELRPNLLSDLGRLAQLVKTRGIRVVMIDLPDAGKALDKGLSCGMLNEKHLPNVLGSRKKGTLLFSSLFNLIFDEPGYILYPDPNDVFFLRQILYLWKKVKKECTHDSIENAVNEYLEIEARLSSPSLCWDDDCLGVPFERRLKFRDGEVSKDNWFQSGNRCPGALLELLDQVCGLVISRFPVLDETSLVPKHGPGAVADVKTGEDKYSFPNYPSKLDGFFPAELYVQTREDLHRETSLTRSRHEPPARLIAVPKTLKGPRMIASEPTAQQFLQQGLLRWLRENIPSPLGISIDFLSQVPSRELALQASIDGIPATVDLSAASDRLSCWVIERMFQYNTGLMRALHAVRTRWLTNATGVGEPFNIRLKKFAAQGNAVTFPVQTIAYTLFCYAALLYEDGRKATYSNLRKVAKEVRVFGDDIILPSHAVWSLHSLLAYCELEVNASKTHWDGYFRESCGMDAYKGTDVSPCYLSAFQVGDNAESLVSWVDVSNNAHKNGLFQLARWMMDQVPVKVRKLIPISNTEQSCIAFASYSTGTSCLKKRFSKTLHRDETLGLQVNIRPVWRRRDSHESLLQFFVEDPSPDLSDRTRHLSDRSDWASGYLVRKRSVLRRRWVSIL